MCCNTQIDQKVVTIQLLLPGTRNVIVAIHASWIHLPALLLHNQQYEYIQVQPIDPLNCVINPGVVDTERPQHTHTRNFD